MNQDDPILLGRCGNQLSRSELCLNKIFSDDDEWIDLGASKLLCGGCVNKLLFGHKEIDLDAQGKPILRGKGKVQRRSTFGFGKTVRAA